MLRLAITDRRLAVPIGESRESNLQQHLVTLCAALAANGVDYLLVREMDLDAHVLVRLSREVVATVRSANPAAKVLIARRPDVALAAGADGVHLSAALGELTPAQVRRLMPSAIVSVSCHSLEEVERARDQNVSAILFGPVFGKTVDGVEVTPGIGLEILREACTIAGKTPVFALGGITRRNAPACQAAGATGIAAIRMFFPGPDPRPSNYFP